MMSKANKLILLILILLLATLFLFAPAKAAEYQLTAVWTMYPTPTDLDGIKLFRNTSAEVVDDTIAADAVTVTFNTVSEGECLNFWLRPYKGSYEGPMSDVAEWCPPGVDPDTPPVFVKIPGFTITTTTVVTPNQ